MDARIFLGLPSYGSDPERDRKKGDEASQVPGRLQWLGLDGSLLAHVFNVLWAGAVAKRATHFAMCHADVEPEPGWVDVLLAEMERLKADVVSVVLPFRQSGKQDTTSTAIDRADGYLWEPLKKLTLADVAKLPETFNANGAGYGGHRLLVNTGCFLADLRKPWARRVCFTIQDRIVWTDGCDLPSVQVIPEDWHFSRQVQDAGGKVFATTKVRAKHGRYWNKQGCNKHETPAIPAATG